MSNQSDIQAWVREQTGTEFTYEGDWHALFDADDIPEGTFNERLLLWLNTQDSVDADSLPQAMQEWAESLDAYNWDSITADLLPELEDD